MLCFRECKQQAKHCPGQTLAECTSADTKCAEVLSVCAMLPGNASSTQGT